MSQAETTTINAWPGAIEISSANYRRSVTMPDCSSQVLRYASIDDALGSADGRYLGDGYRQVRHRLGSLELTARGPELGRVVGKAAVVYPPNWSVKNPATDLRPHLSSIDALVLAFGLAECCVAYPRNLDISQRRRMWIRSVQVRAGSAPVTDLSDLTIQARISRTEPDLLSMCGNISTVDCQIGSIKVSCDIEHEPGSPRHLSPFTATAEELLGIPEQRYYGEGYKLTERKINNLCVDPEIRGIEALVKVAGGISGGGTGIGAAYQPSFSPVDTVVIVAQLAQVLMYATDHLRREGTSTLWMRRFGITLRTPYQPVMNAFVASLSTARSRLIPLGGKTWRTVDMSADALGISGTFSLTHSLPPVSADAGAPFTHEVAG